MSKEIPPVTIGDLIKAQNEAEKARETRKKKTKKTSTTTAIALPEKPMVPGISFKPSKELKNEWKRVKLADKEKAKQAKQVEEQQEKDTEEKLAHQLGISVKELRGRAEKDEQEKREEEHKSRVKAARKKVLDHGGKSDPAVDTLVDTVFPNNKEYANQDGLTRRDEILLDYQGKLNSLYGRDNETAEETLRELVEDIREVEERDTEESADIKYVENRWHRGDVFKYYNNKTEWSFQKVARNPETDVYEIELQRYPEKGQRIVEDFEREQDPETKKFSHHPIKTNSASETPAVFIEHIPLHGFVQYNEMIDRAEEVLKEANVTLSKTDSFYEIKNGGNYIVTKSEVGEEKRGNKIIPKFTYTEVAVTGKKGGKDVFETRDITKTINWERYQEREITKNQNKEEQEKMFGELRRSQDRRHESSRPKMVTVNNKEAIALPADMIAFEKNRKLTVDIANSDGKKEQWFIYPDQGKFEQTFNKGITIIRYKGKPETRVISIDELEKQNPGIANKILEANEFGHGRVELPRTNSKLPRDYFEKKVTPKLAAEKPREEKKIEDPKQKKKDDFKRRLQTATEGVKQTSNIQRTENPPKNDVEVQKIPRSLQMQKFIDQFLGTFDALGGQEQHSGTERWKTIKNDPVLPFLKYQIKKDEQDGVMWALFAEGLKELGKRNNIQPTEQTTVEEFVAKAFT